MNSMDWRTLVGFGLLAAGTLTGAVWLGFDGFLLGARPWLPVATAVLVVVGTGCLFLSRPKLYASMVAKASRDVVAALEDHSDQLERIATLPDSFGTSVERFGKQVEDLAHQLERDGNRLERLTMELVEARQQEGTDAVDLKLPIGQSDSSPRPDLRHELTVAWKRYRDGGDGHFNAEGFKVELARAGIDVDVRSLDDQAGHAVLLIDDPWASDRSFFVVPDFNRSPKSAEHWFEDESSRRLGGRTDELKKLARGRWSENGPEIVEKGSVA